MGEVVMTQDAGVFRKEDNPKLLNETDILGRTVTDTE